MAAPAPSLRPSPAPRPRRAYRYYDLVMAAFVTVLLCANLIGASKVARLGGVTFGAGVLFFPILALLLWVLITSIVLLRRSGSAVAA